MTDESQIKREICEYLETFPHRILFTISPPKRTKFSSKFMRAGWPDIYGAILKPLDVAGNSAKPFFIEVKKPGGTLSIEQHHILEKAKAMGAITCVATCLLDVKKALSI